MASSKSYRDFVLEQLSEVPNISYHPMMDSTKKTHYASGERCRELIDAADEMTRRLYCVVDWLALHPEYNPKTKVIPKKDYPVLVDVTF